MTVETDIKNSEEYIADIIEIKERRKREIRAISLKKRKRCEEQGKYCGVTCLECLSKRLKGARNEDKRKKRQKV